MQFSDRGDYRVRVLKFNFAPKSSQNCVFRPKILHFWTKNSNKIKISWQFFDSPKLEKGIAPSSVFPRPRRHRGDQ